MMSSVMPCPTDQAPAALMLADQLACRAARPDTAAMWSASSAWSMPAPKAMAMIAMRLALSGMVGSMNTV